MENRDKPVPVRPAPLITFTEALAALSRLPSRTTWPAELGAPMPQHTPVPSFGERSGDGLTRQQPAAPSLPRTVYVVRATYDDHPADGVYLTDAAAEAAAHVIAGDGARSYPGEASGYTAVVTAAGDIAASILAQPLHADVDAPPRRLARDT